MYLFDTDVLSNIVKRNPSQILLEKLGTSKRTSIYQFYQSRLKSGMSWTNIQKKLAIMS